MTRAIDNGIERQQELDELRIQEVARRAHEVRIPATGFCLNCEEPLDGERRWCDPDCLADWEKRERD